MYYLLLFILGSAFGSFLNVVIDRLPKGKPIIFSRSVCESCLKQLFIFDLIPVISYIILRGRCRNCKTPIPKRILFIEITSGLLFALVFFMGTTHPLQYALLSTISLILLGISIIDIEHGIIPDKLLLLLGLFSLLLITATNPNSIPSHVISGILTFLFFLILFAVTRAKGIGFGDVKYAFFIGFLLSPLQILIVLYVAFLTGALVSIILIIAGIKRMRGGVISFGPFLSLGVFVALLFEKQIVPYVLSFLGL